MKYTPCSLCRQQSISLKLKIQKKKRMITILFHSDTSRTLQASTWQTIPFSILRHRLYPSTLAYSYDNISAPYNYTIASVKNFSTKSFIQINF